MKTRISILSIFLFARFSFLRTKIISYRRNHLIHRMGSTGIWRKFRFIAMAAVLSLFVTACPPTDDAGRNDSFSSTISGMVTADNSGLAGVTVSLAGAASGTTTTDANGNFTFLNLPDGAYSVTVSGFPEDVSFPQTTRAATISVGQNSVTLNFDGMRVGPVTLNVEIVGNGMVTSGDSQINCGENCSAEYDQDSKTTLTATPANGWMFAGWSGDIPEECDGKTGDCMVVVDKDKTVTATFVEEEEPHSLFFPNPLICIEHGTEVSKILWLFVFDQIFGGGNITIVMRLYFPDESFDEIEIETLEEFLEILVDFDIDEYGLYDWEITEAYYTDSGEEIPIDGTTSGQVDVGAKEQNPGECTM